MNAEWIAIVVTVATSVISGGVTSGVMLWKIGKGQGEAKVREENRDTQIAQISTSLATLDQKVESGNKDTGEKLEKIMNGESKCKLAFVERIGNLEGKVAVVEGQAKSTQAELTEAKREGKL